jgi:hypothetical protein
MSTDRVSSQPLLQVRGSKKGRGSSSQAWNKKTNSKTPTNFVRLQDHRDKSQQYIGPFAVDSETDSPFHSLGDSAVSDSSGAYSRSTAETSASGNSTSTDTTNDVTVPTRRHKSFVDSNSSERHANGLARRHTDIVRSGSDKSSDSLERLNESCSERRQLEQQISDNSVNSLKTEQLTPERVNSISAATSL